MANKVILQENGLSFPLTLSVNGKGKFQVVYGVEVDKNLNAKDAAALYGMYLLKEKLSKEEFK